VLIETESSDALSDALRSLGLRSRIFCRSDLAAPWALAAPAGDFAHFHLISDGRAWLHLPDASSPMSLTAGDLVVLPRGKGHLLSDSRDRDAAPIADLAHIKWRGGMTLIRNGRRGPTTRIICGSFHARRHGGTSVLAELPSVLHVKGRSGVAPEWLDRVSALLTDEAEQGRLGRGAAMARLTDVLMIRVLRHWLERSPDQHGRLAALQDSRIGAALALIRNDPARTWTVAQLAKQVAMSRSAFAARFGELVGEPPLRFVARSRMMRAAELLRTTSLSIEQIAGDLGYATTTAFHKAFKRHFRATPGSIRRT
jgi:AraC-like DNA-binding protein